MCDLFISVEHLDEFQTSLSGAVHLGIRDGAHLRREMIIIKKEHSCFFDPLKYCSFEKHLTQIAYISRLLLCFLS